MPHQPPKTLPKFLIIRRDNIGDLICTTPLFTALRACYPDSLIAALVNSYNRPVLEDNPHIDAVFHYTKAKHRGSSTVLGVYWQRLKTLWLLRKMRFDYVILAGSSRGNAAQRMRRLAWFIRPQQILGPLDYDSDIHSHEVENTFRLLAPLGITGAIPALCLGNKDEHKDARRDEGTMKCIGIHISARKPKQRWSEARFIELIKRLHSAFPVRFLLFWSPGDENNPFHPGDDAKARRILQAIPHISIELYPTQQLEQLMIGLSLCDEVICSDGGAMHIAAALAKPIVCFFGNSDACRWHPWGVPYVLLQKPSREVNDISVEEAFEAYCRLLSQN